MVQLIQRRLSTASLILHPPNVSRVQRNIYPALGDAARSFFVMTTCCFSGQTRASFRLVGPSLQRVSQNTHRCTNMYADEELQPAEQTTQQSSSSRTVIINSPKHSHSVLTIALLQASSEKRTPTIPTSITTPQHNQARDTTTKKAINSSNPPFIQDTTPHHNNSKPSPRRSPKIPPYRAIIRTLASSTR